jgi:hypothetical protein
MTRNGAAPLKFPAMPARLSDLTIAAMELGLRGHSS